MVAGLHDTRTFVSRERKPARAAVAAGPLPMVVPRVSAGLANGGAFVGGVESPALLARRPRPLRDFAGAAIAGALTHGMAVRARPGGRRPARFRDPPLGVVDGRSIPAPAHRARTVNGPHRLTIRVHAHFSHPFAFFASGARFRRLASPPTASLCHAGSWHSIGVSRMACSARSITVRSRLPTFDGGATVTTAPGEMFRNYQAAAMALKTGSLIMGVIAICCPRFCERCCKPRSEQAQSLASFGSDTGQLINFCRDFPIRALPAVSPSP